MILDHICTLQENHYQKKINYGNEKLSPDAQQIIDRLLSKSKTARNEAIKRAIEVNDYESIEILQTVYSNIISETSIDKDILNSYLEWGKTKEMLFTNVISDLGSLHGEKNNFSNVAID